MGSYLSLLNQHSSFKTGFNIDSQVIRGKDQKQQMGSTNGDDEFRITNAEFNLNPIDDIHDELKDEY